MEPPAPPVPPGRGIYSNRTLNLRSIRAIGYDMDYTLIHYNVEEWERRAYEIMREKLLADGWPVQSLTFDPGAVIRGLIIDRELGNIVKANRFGYIKRAAHGRRMLGHDAQRAAYGRTVVDLAEDRWRFLNTFFSLSEACMYASSSISSTTDCFPACTAIRICIAGSRPRSTRPTWKGRSRPRSSPIPSGS